MPVLIINLLLVSINNEWAILLSWTFSLGYLCIELYNQRDILYLFEKGFSKYELYYVVALCFDYFNIEERKTR